MSLTSDPKISHKPVLEFKSGSFTVPSLHLVGNDLDAIKIELEIKIKQAPDFFSQSAIIIDLQTLTEKKYHAQCKRSHRLSSHTEFPAYWTERWYYSPK